jgi:murein L,D-transpeptidase YafK
LAASAAFAAAIALSGCDTDNTNPSLSAKALAPIPPKTLSMMAEKNMAKESPMLVRIFKEESELEVWKQDGSGHYALLKTFPICRWSGDLGPKVREGDRQAPEGFYSITPGLMNPASNYYLAVNMGFPNTYDKANDRTGNFLMIHGDCSSRGCYAMTDEQIAEIYAIARESFFGGQRSFQIQAYPFRMTPVNLAKHRTNPNMPFWKMLKEGYDHFEVTRQEPKVDVCEKRYVFDAQAPEGAAAPKFSPRAQCPVYEVPSEIASAVAEKKKKDDTQLAQLIGRGTPVAPVKMATDGGMHQIFADALQGRAVRNSSGEVERVYTPAKLPGTIPDTVNPPSNVMMANSPPPAAAPAAQPAAPRTNSVVRTAAKPAARPAQAASAQPTQTAAASPSGLEKTKNFLSGLFRSKADETQTAAAAPSAPAQASKPVTSRAAVRTPAHPAAPAAAPAQAATPKPAPTAVAEAKPTPLPEPEAAAARPSNAGAIRPMPSAVTAFSGMPDSRGGLLSGAAPVVPAGTFGGTGWNLR